MKNGCITVLGNFDGVHLGHKALLDEAVSLRRKTGMPVKVWTFSELPCKDSGAKGQLIMPSYQREWYLRKYGADEICFEDFDNVKNMPPWEFADKILFGELGTKMCVCGFNYRFGKGGEGGSDTLLDIAKEYNAGCSVVDAVTDDGIPISSTRIRKLILEGNVEKAVKLLGHVFYTVSEVIHGKHLGRTWGFPTVNQIFSDKCVKLKNGVYASCAVIGGRLYPSVTNIGTCPTVTDSGKVVAETHILGFSGDLYGEKLCVGYLSRLRDEKKFESENDLRNAISADIERAEAVYRDVITGGRYADVPHFNI